MTDELSPAERFSASIGYTGPAPQQQATEQPAGAPAPAGQPVVAPWGTMHTDPQEALDALNARPDFQAALFDASNPGHKAAIAARSRIFTQLYGDGRGDTLQGDGSGNMSPAIHEGYQEPTPEQMQAAHVSTAADIIERAGIFDPDTYQRVDPETAKNIAETAVACGLSTLEISDISQGIGSSRQYTSPEAALAELGTNAAAIVRAAQQEAHAMGLPAELLNLEIGDICLGEHPAMIKALARRRGIR